MHVFLFGHCSNFIFRISIRIIKTDFRGENIDDDSGLGKAESSMPLDMGESQF